MCSRLCCCSASWASLRRDSRSFSSTRDISPSRWWPAVWRGTEEQSLHEKHVKVCRNVRWQSSFPSLTSVSSKFCTLMWGSDSMARISAMISNFLLSSACASSSAWRRSSRLCSETSFTVKVAWYWWHLSLQVHYISDIAFTWNTNRVIHISVYVIVTVSKFPGNQSTWQHFHEKMITESQIRRRTYTFLEFLQLLFSRLWVLVALCHLLHQVSHFFLLLQPLLGISPHQLSCLQQNNTFFIVRVHV